MLNVCLTFLGLANVLNSRNFFRYSKNLILTDQFGHKNREKIEYKNCPTQAKFFCNLVSKIAKMLAAGGNLGKIRIFFKKVG